VFVCPLSYLWNYTSDFQTFLSTFATDGPDTLSTSVMFAHKLSLLDVAAQLKRSAHAALGLVINCAQFVVKHC